MNIFFHNKGMEQINLPRILHSSRVNRHVPSFFNHTSPPMVSYSYQKPIAGKIFNYKQAIRELDFDSGTNKTCNCAHLKYNYIPAGLVVTGELLQIDMLETY